MQALILCHSHTEEALLRLSNGETVLGRQVRLLKESGIYDLIIQVNAEAEAVKAACEGVKGVSLTFVQSDEAQMFCPDWMERYAQQDTVVLSGHWIFSKEFLRDFINKENEFMLAVGDTSFEPTPGMKVKLDMNKAKYLSTEISGYGSFAYFPIYKMNVGTLLYCIRAQRETDSPEAAFRMAAEAFPLQAFYAKDYWVQDVSAADDREALVEKARTHFYRELNIIGGAQAVLQLSEKINENNIRRLLILSDTDYQALPVKNLLPAGVDSEVCQVTSCTLALAEELKEKLISGEFDALLSLGGEKAISLGKLVTFLSAQGEQGVIKRLYHMTMPVKAELNHLFAPFVKVAGERFAHDVMLPDLIISDRTVTAKPDREERLSGALGIFICNLDLLLGCRAEDSVAEAAARNLAKAAKHLIPYVDDALNRKAAGELLQVALQTSRLTAREEESILAAVARPLAEALSMPLPQACLYFASGILRTLHKHMAEEKIKDILAALEVKSLKQAENLFSALQLKFTDFPVLESGEQAALLADQAQQVRGLSILLSEKDIRRMYLHLFTHSEERLALHALKGQDPETLTEEDAEASKVQHILAAETWKDLLLHAGCVKVKNGRRSVKQRLKHLMYVRFTNQSAVRKLFNRLLFVKRRLDYLRLRKKYPVDKKMILFEAYGGKKYNCNPRGLYEELLRDPAYCDFKFVWAFTNPKAHRYLASYPNTTVVKLNSGKYRRACAKAGYWIANAAMPAYLVPKKDQKYIHTWHGKPFKAIGCDVGFKTAGGRGAKENKKVYSAVSRKLSVLFSPAPIFTRRMTSAFNLKRLGKADIVYESGYPRNDYLFKYDPADAVKVKLELGIPLDKKVVLYAPTWRPTVYEPGVGYIYHQALDFDRLHEALGDDCVVIFRAHINEERSVDFNRYGDFLIDATRVENVNDLYIISDLMISDYSGTIFDYANLKRPIVLYMYDKDQYINDWTGTYFDPEVLPGEIVMTQDELHASVLKQLEHFVYDEKYRAFNETFNALDGPDCAKRIIDELIDPMPQPSKAAEKKEQRRIKLRTLKVKVRGAMRVLGLKRDKNTLKLKSYRNKHLGERCFLIGNGPSLTMADLETVQNEITFSCNLIYKIFDKTSWRPTYHCLTDNIFTKTVSEELAQEITMPLFINHVAYAAMRRKKKVRINDVISVQSVPTDPYYVKGNLLNYYVSSKATVMSFMIELAIYMGFKEIYLLGVDCSNGFTGQQSHFIEDYENEDMMRIEHKRAKTLMRGKHMTLEELGKYRQDRAMFAYSVLRKYADAHGVKVMNATRGGMLEEFERVNLDELDFTVNEGEA